MKKKLLLFIFILLIINGCTSSNSYYNPNFKCNFKDDIYYYSSPVECDKNGTNPTYNFLPF